MMLGSRNRMGARTRGQARLPAVTVEGAITALSSLAVTGLITGIGNPTIRGTDGIIGPSGSLALTADTMYAQHLGKTLDAITSVSLQVYVSGVAAAGAGWAEIAIATGTFTPITSPTLTPRGYASIDTEVKAGATASYSKTISGLAIDPETDIWAIVACNYATTQAALRLHAGDGDRAGVSPRRAAGGRPSLAIGSALAFTYTAGNAQIGIWGGP